MKSLFKSGYGLFVLVVLFIGLALAITFGLRGERLDLTENHLYTLSDGTVHILDSLKKPITLTLYFSNKTSTNLPALRSYEKRVSELLQEYQFRSHGKIKLKVVDPEPFSDAEDTATEAGLKSVPAGNSGDKVFFGLIGETRSGHQKTIPFFQMNRQSSLEYDVTKLVYSLEHPQEPVVGVISGLDINGGFDYARRAPSQPWIVVQQMEDLFKVRWLGQNVSKIGKDVDVLMVVDPTDLSDQARMAIDQYVLGGGKLIVFVDPNAESADANPMLGGHGTSSNLPKLFRQWGVKFSADKIVGDYDNSLVVGVGQQHRPVRDIALLGLTNEDFDRNDVILSGLNNINMSTAGFFTPIAHSGLKVQPLLYSSDDAMPIEAKKLLTMRSPDQLMDGFKPTGKRYILAARITGKAQTAFPEGIQVKVPADKSKAAAKDKTANSGKSKPKPKETTILPRVSSGDINVMVVGDTDILTDRLWVQISNFFGQRVAQPWADNGNFLINALDNYAGSKDLISIRSRGEYTRPFVRVQAMRRDAESSLLKQEETLKQRLKQTEDKLNKLQQAEGKKHDKSLLTDEQKKTLLQFREEKLKIRKQLRNVEHQLNSDIEALGTKLKLLNIVVMPLLLTLLLALVTWLWRRWARR